MTLLYITNLGKICAPDFLAHMAERNMITDWRRLSREWEEAWKQLSGQKVWEIFPVQLLEQFFG